jgi:hypothetical protein
VTVAAIEAFLSNGPFRPFCLVTASGESYKIPHPEFVTFSSSRRTCNVYADDGEFLSTLDVFDHHRYSATRTSARTAALEIPRPAAIYSSDWASFASTLKSSSVVVSPVTVAPLAISFRSRRMILPLRVFGSASAKRTSSGLAIAPMCALT